VDQHAIAARALPPTDCFYVLIWTTHWLQEGGLPGYGIVARAAP
jgi:hypothetical protein